MFIKSSLRILLFVLVQGLLTLIIAPPHVNPESLTFPPKKIHNKHFKITPLDSHASLTFDPQKKSLVPGTDQRILLANKSKEVRKACMNKCVQADNACERSLKIEYRDDRFKQCLLLLDQCRKELRPYCRGEKHSLKEKCKESVKETSADIGSCQFKTELCSRACGCEHSMDANCH